MFRYVSIELLCNYIVVECGDSPSIGNYVQITWVAGATQRTFVASESVFTSQIVDYAKYKILVDNSTSNNGSKDLSIRL